jgi:hypothetical protein
MGDTCNFGHLVASRHFLVRHIWDIAYSLPFASPWRAQA